MRYRYNPHCSCGRCRAHGLMGLVVLITLGVLFLLDQMDRLYWLHFHNTWPALLIVIGLVMFLQHNASMAGHVPREYGATPPAWRPPDQPYGMPPYPPQPPAVPPPAASPGPGAPDSNRNKPDDSGVSHG